MLPKSLLPSRRTSVSEAVVTSRVRRMSLGVPSNIEKTQDKTRTVTLVFELELWTKPGQQVYIVGDRVRGGDKGIPMKSEDMHCIWTSPELTFHIDTSAFSMDYRYLLSTNGGDLVELTPIRHISIQLPFVQTFTYTLHCRLEEPGITTIDTSAGYAILRNVDSTQKFTAQLDQITGILRQRVSLKRLLTLYSYLKQTFEEQKGDIYVADTGVCYRLLRITRFLSSQMTKETRPIIGKIVLLMGRGCKPYKEIMKSITNSSLHQRSKVDFGCESEALTGLLEELFTSTPRDDMGMIRVIVLNSLRGAIQSLWGKSTRPELLLMYDVWISVLQQSYIETQFLSSDPSNIPNLLHQVSILAEYSQLGAICPDIHSLAEELQKSQSPVQTRDLLAHMLQTATWWLSRYVKAGQTLGTDFLNLNKLLINIGAESVNCLFLILSRTYSALSTSISPSFSLGLCPGQATGKVLYVNSLEDIPTGRSAVIALAKDVETGICDLQKQVKGLLLIGNSGLSAYLVANCLEKKAILGLTAQDRWGKDKNKVEIRVTQDKITLF